MFKPGDLAELMSYPISEYGLKGVKHVGDIVTIRSFPYELEGFNVVDIDHEQYDSAETKYLRKIDGDYDGHEKTTWDECVWKPSITVDA